MSIASDEYSVKGIPEAALQRLFGCSLSISLVTVGVRPVCTAPGLTVSPGLTVTGFNRVYQPGLPVCSESLNTLLQSYAEW
jgi:hypothetical protein